MKATRVRSGWSTLPAVASLCLLTGCATAKNYLEPDEPLYEGVFAGGSRQRPAPERLRVVTFNIEHATHVKEATELLRSRPELAGADVLLLQEMTAPAVEEIAKALSLDYVYYPASHHTKLKKDIGNAILSPWPIVERSKIVLPHLSRFSHHARSAVSARLKIGNRYLRAYSLHLGTPINLSGKQRREQLGAIVADAQRAGREPVLIGGDFNGKSMAEYLSEQGYAWPTRNVGKTTTLLKYSFDHVLMRGLVAAPEPNVGVLRDVAGVSDHFPVWTLLRFE